MHFLLFFPPLKKYKYYEMCKILYRNIFEMAKISAEGQTFVFDEKVNSLSNYFKDLKEFEGENKEFELKTIKKEDIGKVLEACKVTNYAFREVTKVNGNDAIAYIG